MMDPQTKAARSYWVRVDTKEQSRELKDFADEVVKLQYLNPERPGNPYSLDIELQTCGDQLVRFERKKGMDAVNSFAKLDRQLGAVDAIILEAFPTRRSLVLAGRSTVLYDAARKRLWRLAYTKAVHYTDDVWDTLRLLDYLGRKPYLEIRAYGNEATQLDDREMGEPESLPGEVPTLPPEAKE